MAPGPDRSPTGAREEVRVKLIGLEWATYRERVVPASAGQLQVQECRRAFYASAEAFWRAISKHLEPGEEVTEPEVDALDAMHRELVQFAVDVVEGRA